MVSAFREALDYDGPILAGKALVWAVLLWVLALNGVDGLVYASWSQNLAYYLLVLGVITVIVAVQAMYRARPASPIRFLIARATSTSCLSALARGTPMLATMVIWMPIFSAAKSAIPLFHPYNWDRAWIALDRAIFGTDAWRVIQPLLGHPLVTSLLSVAYHAWILLVYVGGIYFCFFVKDRELRAQYLIARFATWTILGVGMATMFASLGPCFVGPILGDHTFDPQMAYLRAANEHYRVFVLPVQDALLAGYRGNAYGLGGGISSMPSIHVATALVTALAVWRRSRLAGACLYTFLVVIVVASVHLGYHYAVDDIVSVAGALIVWKISGLAASLTVRRGETIQAAGVPTGHPAALPA